MKLSSSMNKTFSYLVLALFVITGIQAQSIQIFSPEPGSSLAPSEVLIAASFFGIEGVQPSSVKLTINGDDVSNEADIDEEMLTLTPVDLSPGPHNIQILINRSGAEPMLRNWTFTVLSEEETKPFDYEFSGRATSGFRYEKIGEEELNIAHINGSLNGSASNWLKFKSNIKLTSEEDPLIQPRNRFGFSATLGNVAELKFGDFNPRVTHFTLDGKRVRGMGLKTQLGFFHFSGIFGELTRTVQGSEAPDQSFLVSSYAVEGNEEILDITRKGYTFRQNVLAVRTGFGRGKLFQMGAGFVKVKDDIGSVNASLSNALVKIDSSFTGQSIQPGEYTFSELVNNSNVNVSLAEKSKWAGKTPNDNLIVSSDLAFFLDNKRIVLEGEVAFSMLNRNIWDGAVSLDELDTLMDEDDDGKLMGEMDLDNIPIDPGDFENIFVINQNMSPLIPVNPGVFDDSSTMSMSEALNSMPSLAYRTKARLNYLGHYFSVEFSQVGPEFFSLANPYLLNNNRQLTISDRIQLMDGRMLLSISYKHQDNDILLDQPVVKSQNTLNTNLTYLPGPNLPTITLMFRMSDRDNGISTLDTLINSISGETVTTYTDNRENTRTGNISATLSHSISAFGMNHNLSATFMNYDRKDQVDSYRDLDPGFIDPGMKSQVINVVALTKFNFPLKTTINVTMNGAEFSTGPSTISKQDLLSMKAEGDYKLFNGRLSILAGVNYLNGEGLTEISRIGLLGGARYRIHENLFAQLRTEFRENLAVEENKNNVIAVATLNYSF